MSRLNTVFLLSILVFSSLISFTIIPSSLFSINESIASSPNERSSSVSSPNFPSSIRILTRGYPGIPSFNPILDLTFVLPITTLVYDPLISIDPKTGELVPALIKQWVVTNDSMEWTLYLRDDVIFHDGSRFNASIVKETFERVLNVSHPDYSNLFESAFSPIDSCEILEEFVVRVKMKTPGNPFNMNFPGIALTLDEYFPYNFTEFLLQGELGRIPPPCGKNDTTYWYWSLST